MRRLLLAFKAFCKAFMEPAKGALFLSEVAPSKRAELAEASHLRLLHYLQHSGRFIDFLKEDIGPLSDAQIGAAVRKIHQDCAQTIEELVTIRPLRDEPEGAVIQVFKGYNPAEIKLVGKIKGEPPFSGVLVHRGWKAQKRALPKITAELPLEVVCPAEVEIKAGP